MNRYLLLVSLFSQVFTLKSSNKSAGDVIGEAYNSDDHQDVVAVTYGQASDGGNSLPDPTGFRLPQIVEHIADVIKPPVPGPVTSVDEVPSTTNYYDGSLNLNVAQVNCHVINVPTECYKSTVCGWCSSTGQCVSGNSAAPLESCSSGYNFAGFAKL